MIPADDEDFSALGDQLRDEAVKQFHRVSLGRRTLVDIPGNQDGIHPLTVCDGDNLLQDIFLIRKQ